MEVEEIEAQQAAAAQLVQQQHLALLKHILLRQGGRHHHTGILSFKNHNFHISDYIGIFYILKTDLFF